MTMFRGLIVAAAMLFVIPAQAVPAFAGIQNATTVVAPAGAITGVIEGTARVFKGIPYAAPPVGALRWRAPKAFPVWAGTRAANRFGPACDQAEAPAGIYTNALPAMSEDCLFLNVWTPPHAAKAPVIVWIHGGALAGGHSDEALYDGQAFAKRGVILVSINYRLGVLGFLAHPDLSAELPDHVSGNYGLLDQIEALRWVKANIAAFGGDPANVTIAGESAGGLSVMYLLTAPSARGLFAKAISESAYMVSMPELSAKANGMPSSESTGAALAAKFWGRSIAELRAMDGEDVTLAAGALGFAPWITVDGKVVPKQLVDSFDRGEQAPVPLLAGFNAGEIRSLPVLLPPGPPPSSGDYETAIQAHYGDLADAFLRLYPDTNVHESQLAAVRDAVYGWTAERLVRKQTALGQPAFLYFFDHGYPTADFIHAHAFHASELPYVFGRLDHTTALWPPIPNAASEKALSDAMADYWTSFARDGRPQANGEAAWAAYGSARAYMHFADTPQAGDDFMPGMYDLNEQVMCRKHGSGDTPWNWNVGTASPVLPGPNAACH